jgi:hypothetical protein
MNDLQNILPQESETVKAIYEYYKRRGDSEETRGYLGASIIGSSCERYLWYVFRFCCRKRFDGRMYRLLETGDKEEERIVQDLRNIGCTVHVIDEETGEQFAVQAIGGHFFGHLDGCVLGVKEAPKTWHVLECKTHNDKSFNGLTKKGIKWSKPQHYAQMQIYMHLSGMTRALYFAVNKNTDELYAERVRYNQEEAEGLVERAKEIIFATNPPERISTRSDFFECKWCDAREICWGSERALPVPSINCRQCCHATPTLDGNACWKCEKHKKQLSLEDQNKACGSHLCLPGLIHFAHPTDSGTEWIEFENNYGEKFWHCNWRPDPGGCRFTTKELISLKVTDLYNPMVSEAKKHECVVQDNIISRYEDNNCFVVWHGSEDEIASELKKNGCVKQIATAENFDNKVVEFDNDAIAIWWPDRKECEIVARIPF